VDGSVPWVSIQILLLPALFTVTAFPQEILSINMNNNLQQVQFGMGNLNKIQPVPGNSHRINSSDVGFNVHEWDSPAGLKYDASASSDTPYESGEVDLSRLHTIQGTMKRSAVESYIHDSPSKAPLITKVGSRHFIDDGHHQLAAAKMRGETKVTANIRKVK
jgi:hypothetical protein